MRPENSITFPDIRASIDGCVDLNNTLFFHLGHAMVDYNTNFRVEKEKELLNYFSSSIFQGSSSIESVLQQQPEDKLNLYLVLPPILFIVFCFIFEANRRCKKKEDTSSTVTLRIDRDKAKIRRDIEGNVMKSAGQIGKCMVCAKIVETPIERKFDRKSPLGMTELASKVDGLETKIESMHALLRAIALSSDPLRAVVDEEMLNKKAGD